MLQLIDILQANGTIEYIKQFCDDIKIEKQNVNNVKNGHQSFTTAHIRKACMVYGINVNWIFGIEKKIYRH